MVIKSDSNGKRHYIVPVCNMMYRLVTAVPPPPPSIASVQLQVSI